MDPIDTSIVEILTENGRTSNREVARSLGVSEGMVRQRLKKLIDAKVISYGLVTDLEAIGFLATVIVRLKTEPASARQVARELAAMEFCTFSSLTLGRFDVVAVLVAKNRSEIARVVDHSIRPITGIIGIDIVEPVKATKHRYDLVYLP